MTQSATIDVPRLAPDLAGVRMTPEEFDAAEEFDADYNYELIDGVLVVSPIAGEVERSPNGLLGYLLNRHQFEHPAGSRLVETLFEQQVKVAGSRRRADRVVWTVVDGRPQNPKTELPAIVIEFLSAGRAAWRRDHIEKQDEYREAGILEYWVIDRFARTLTVYVQRDGEPVEVVIREGDVCRTNLLPGFELPLAELLAAADRWSKPE